MKINNKTIFLVWLFLGIFGAHRFLLGAKQTGFLMLLWAIAAFFVLRTGGITLLQVSVIVWWIADFFILIKPLISNPVRHLPKSYLNLDDKIKLVSSLYLQQDFETAYQTNLSALQDCQIAKKDKSDALLSDTNSITIENLFIKILRNHAQLARITNRPLEATESAKTISQLLFSEHNGLNTLVDIDNASIALFNAGLVFLDDKNFIEAKQCFEQNLLWIQSFPVTASIEDEVYIGLARALEGMGDLTGAIEQMQIALNVLYNQKPQIMEKLIDVNGHLAIFYHQNSQNDKAQHFIKVAKDLAIQLNNPMFLSHVEYVEKELLI